MFWPRRRWRTEATVELKLPVSREAVTIMVVQDENKFSNTILQSQTRLHQGLVIGTKWCLVVIRTLLSVQIGLLSVQIKYVQINLVRITNQAAEAAGAVLKIDLSLKYYGEIQLAKICETLCRSLNQNMSCYGVTYGLKAVCLKIKILIFCPPDELDLGEVAPRHEEHQRDGQTDNQTNVNILKLKIKQII